MISRPSPGVEASAHLRHDSVGFCLYREETSALYGWEHAASGTPLSLLHCKGSVFLKSLPRHLTSLTCRALLYHVGALPPGAAMSSLPPSFKRKEDKIKACIQPRFSTSRYSAAGGLAVGFSHRVAGCSLTHYRTGSPLVHRRQLIPFPAGFPFQTLSDDQTGALAAIKGNNLGGGIAVLASRNTDSYGP